ncbi:MAG: menaquinol dehydrogenase NapGH, periplasmic component NapG, partial [Bacteroidota bacterium]
MKGTAVVTGGGLLWGAVASSAKASPLALRPPGAADADDFVRDCVRCGKCVEVCPYDTLKLAQIGNQILQGTPFFEPRNTPCYLCTDFPCTDVCPSDALSIERITDRKAKPDIRNARMGLAVIHKESCLAYWGIRCDACY